MSPRALGILIFAALVLIVLGFGLVWLPLGVVAAGCAVLVVAMVAAGGSRKGDET